MQRIALLIETSRDYGRELLQGVKQYSIEHGPWSLFVETRDLESKPPAWLDHWDGDGILTRSGSDAIADAVHHAGVPTVELRSTRRGFDFPFVGVDNQVVGQMTADYFMQRGFRHFGVFSLETEQFFVERRDSFIAAVQSHGCVCSELRQQGVSEKPSEWETQQTRLIEWVTKLPKPVAIMACTDLLGCWLLDACSRSGIQVPEQVAVVGVENESTIATMSNPPLSSVRLAGRQIGYQAAAVLDRLMKGQEVPSAPLLIPPLCVVGRASSDTLAVEDPLIRQAVEVMRTRACEGLNVEGVLAEVPISRSALERSCRRLLGRSPNAEITRVRVESVCELLRETELNLEQIAKRTGFSTAQYMSHLFRKTKSITPGEYRKRYSVT